jgi:hypothetical protein
LNDKNTLSGNPHARLRSGAMGGSLQQAQGVYNYFTGHIYAQPTIVSALPDEPPMKETKSDKGNYFKAVAASPKAVRGPHPDNLFIDEACETKDQLILDAIPQSLRDRFGDAVNDLLQPKTSAKKRGSSY